MRRAAFAGRIEQAIAAGRRQRRATGQPQCCQHPLARQGERRVEQTGVAAIDHAALEPDAGQLDALREAAAVEGFAAGRQAECQQVPADHLGTRGQLESHPVLAVRSAVADRLERQPLEPRSVADARRRRLQRPLAGAAIEAARTRCRQQRMRLRRERDVELERVAADDAARRVHEHVVADTRVFGVQALPHAQRAAVAVVHDGLRALDTVAELESAVPAHAAQCAASAATGAAWRTCGLICVATAIAR